ncbi:MAG TPA: FAD/NAD(P)-binding protein [Bacteroidia bacterium]|jgi:uncharacterized NAD(P)/FAD-binding protein YdhS|nr:FAD/NAD(P)-binding protein [Bacteroidia bacterium]
MEHKKRILIVGGGLSGTLVSLALARLNKTTEFLLVEKNPGMIGRGIAYNHDFTHQPLNVMATGMSLFSDEPNHFLDWLTENKFRYRHLLPDVNPKVFAPRKVFGDYIVEHLDRIHHIAPGRFQIRIDEVVSLRRKENKFRAKMESGTEIEADHVVLALGNFPPGDLFPENDPVNSDPRYFSNPWTDRIYSNLGGEEHILLVGTGLTAVDVVLGLKTRGFKGKVSMISRRGRLPLPHDVNTIPVKLEYPGHLHPREAWQWLKNKIESDKNNSWVAYLDGLRPLTQEFWKSWSIEERKYFMKRLRPFWEVFRHRIPLASHTLLSEMEKSGQLLIAKANISEAKLSAAGIEVVFDKKSGLKNDVFSKIINCTGPESNYRKVKFPIIVNLMNQGLVTADELGLGIKCTADGKIIDKNNSTVEGLWCIGPMRKSALWETTAIRELREQAEEFAKRF